jgi:hypothetical protein
MNKKQMILAAMTLFAATNIAQAQFFFPVLEKYTTAQKDRVEKQFLVNLESRNNGVVESTLALATMMKLDRPAYELRLLRTKIEELASSSMIPAIRYKACLAKAVFADPAAYRQEGIQTHRDMDDFFGVLESNTDPILITSKQ